MILLARHGETDDNRARRFQGRRNPPLNDTGRAQARELAAEVRDERVVALYASPLARAWETASIVGARLEVQHLADDPRGLPGAGQRAGVEGDDALVAHLGGQFAG
ncbi:MAG TPA: histidine phosphatase family protein, partial [Solirubrobacteraceae bacterium]|nr:histidine phosphatase family protein [Solirubrobacteraceae bacterium]